MLTTFFDVSLSAYSKMEACEEENSKLRRWLAVSAVEIERQDSPYMDHSAANEMLPLDQTKRRRLWK
ncbi:hypothetical protein MLD38_007427 [Melastoma candidum]|uniref:Uncharacterized protein n=1 Tax=Melastoma candidum TaxID=119954 RepID=A0ACB9RVD4_9MYRT|nr:hypothetical protein MLD38_007427 [Melastoma candidum]